MQQVAEEVCPRRGQAILGEAMISVMLFVGGPAEGWLLSSSAQVYAVGLAPPVDGRAMAAIYHRFGTSPSYAGGLPNYQGAFVYKADKVRPVSLIDGWMPGLEEGNSDPHTIVDI